MTQSTLALHHRAGPAGDAAGASARDFVALLKPRVMSLVVFTGFVGLVLAPGSLHPVLAFTAMLCIAAGAGASGAINMWYDADIDARMSRTRFRPVPAGRIAPGTALGFGVTLGTGAVLVMGLAVNLMAAGLLLATILYYVLVYTMWLKRRTPHNIVIGGAAGALPPLIGWSAVTGEVALAPVLLFAIIFFWTPPHFWALALYRRGDYARAGLPMLPVVAGVAETRKQILVYTLVLTAVSLAPWLAGFAGAVYAVGASVLGAAFIVTAFELWRHGSERLARRTFAFSICYLLLIFLLLLADRAAAALVGV